MIARICVLYDTLSIVINESLLWLSEEKGVLKSNGKVILLFDCCNTCFLSTGT